MEENPQIQLLASTCILTYVRTHTHTGTYITHAHIHTQKRTEQKNQEIRTKIVTCPVGAWELAKVWAQLQPAETVPTELSAGVA